MSERVEHTSTVPAKPVNPRRYRRNLLNEAVDHITVGDDAVNLAHESYGSASEKLSELRDLLQDDFDDKSEKWQEGEAGEARQEAIQSIESAISALESWSSDTPDTDIDGLDV